MRCLDLLWITLLLPAVGSRAAGQSVVVPPIVGEGNGLSGLPMTGHAGRHQLLIARSHLLGLGVPWLVGEIWLRRDMTDPLVTMRGGSIDLEVWAGNAPQSFAREVFAANRGADHRLVFQGTLTVPDAAPAPQAPAPWAPPYAFRIPFTQAVVDHGGDLLLEFVIRPHTVLPGASWWVVDREHIPPVGATTSLGQTCSRSAVPATASAGSGALRVGETTVFAVSGGPMGVAALHVLGLSDATLFGAPILPLDLTPLGAPGCFLRVDTMLITASVTDTSALGYGEARVRIQWPFDTALLNAVGFSQWIVAESGTNALGLAPTNAVRFQLDQVTNRSGLAIVMDEDPGATTGRVYAHAFPVIRLMR